jgi:hypothetical protein
VESAEVSEQRRCGASSVFLADFGFVEGVPDEPQGVPFWCSVFLFGAGDEFFHHVVGDFDGERHGHVSILHQQTYEQPP